MKLSLSILFLFVFFYDSYPQKYMPEEERDRIIYNQITDKYKSLIKNIEDDEQKADKLMELADNFYKQLNQLRAETENIKKANKRYKHYKKMEKVENAALKVRIDALDKYHDAAVRKYQLYKKDIQKFYKNAASYKIDSAKKFEKLAFDAFAKADIEVNIAYHTVNHQELFDIYTRAFVLEQTGLLYQQKIYALFLNWDKPSSKHIDTEIHSLTKMKPFYKLAADTVIHQIIKDSIIYKKVVVHDTVFVKKTSPDIVFKVQIAASRNPIPIKELRKIYNTPEAIQTTVEDGWYKYLVGAFNSYNEAKKFKISIGIKDAFVVAYKNSKRMRIAEVVNDKF